MRQGCRTLAVAMGLVCAVGTAAAGAQATGADGELRIDRFDYDVKWSNTIEAGGGLEVGPEIRIDLQVTALTPRP